MTADDHSGPEYLPADAMRRIVDDERRDGAWVVGGTIWSTWHFPVDAVDDADFELPHLLIGYFSDAARAWSAIELLRDVEGFRQWPCGFAVFEVPLDRGGWEEGFVNQFDDPDWPRPVADKE